MMQERLGATAVMAMAAAMAAGSPAFAGDAGS